MQILPLLAFFIAASNAQKIFTSIYSNSDCSGPSLVVGSYDSGKCYKYSELLKIQCDFAKKSGVGVSACNDSSKNDLPVYFNPTCTLSSFAIGVFSDAACSILLSNTSKIENKLNICHSLTDGRFVKGTCSSSNSDGMKNVFKSFPSGSNKPANSHVWTNNQLSSDQTTSSSTPNNNRWSSSSSSPAQTATSNNSWSNDVPSDETNTTSSATSEATTIETTSVSAPDNSTDNSETGEEDDYVANSSYKLNGLPLMATAMIAFLSMFFLQ